MIVKKNMILMILILMVIAMAIYAISMSFDMQLAGGFNTILGHCVGSACSTL